jgi:hypothetical protein
MKSKLLCLVVVSCIGASGAAMASNVTYDVDVTNSMGSIVGTITTDGTTVPPLATADIAAWSFTVSGSAFSTYTLSSADAGSNVTSYTGNSQSVSATTALSATSSTLSFDFGSQDNLVFFDSSVQSGAFVTLTGSISTLFPKSAIYSGTCEEETQGPPCNGMPSLFSVNASESPSVVTIGTAATPVPLPASAWLLLSSLCGLVMIRQRGRVAV